MRRVDYALDEPHRSAPLGALGVPSAALPELLLFGGVDSPPVPEERRAAGRTGLGRLPADLSSVASLLLFNTEHTPYDEYAALDNLLGRDRSDEKPSDLDGELFAAPRTVAEGDTLPAAAMLDYTYAPELDELPAMSLPSALPNLPGVADLQWSGAGDDVLAPSGSKRGGDRSWADGDRPGPASDAQPPSKAPPPSSSSSSSSSTATAAAAAPAASPASAPPPPPPPPPSSSSSAASTAAAAPPPPPPPPPSSSSSTAAAAAAAPTDTADTGGGGGGGGDGRSDLLASIRAGRKLKKASERAAAADESAPAKHGGGASGDIFSDLMNALSRRRQGIASKKQSAKEVAAKRTEGRVLPARGEAAAPDDGAHSDEWED